MGCYQKHKGVWNRRYTFINLIWICLMLFKDIQFTHCFSKSGNCPIDRFGEFCNKNCHCKSPLDGCDRNTGVCQIQMCNENWYGEACNQTKCPQGRWGQSCQQFCVCAYFENCEILDGKCHFGCQDGWTGQSCNETGCVVGKYGAQCSETCNCGPGTPCIKHSGQCLADLYDLDLCPPGRYGAQCDEKCPNCGGRGHCDPRDGTCFGGCRMDFTGLDCKATIPMDSKEFCPSRKHFGAYCEHKCGRGCAGRGYCTKSGACVEGCRTGFQEPSCSELIRKRREAHCPYGYFGPGCSLKCSTTCIQKDHCDPQTGKCVSGCKPGYEGDYCKTVTRFVPNVHEEDGCVPGRYGEDCSKLCRTCGGQGYCDINTGHCLEGCAEGYKGQLCTTPVGVEILEESRQLSAEGNSALMAEAIFSTLFLSVLLLPFIIYPVVGILKPMVYPKIKSCFIRAKDPARGKGDGPSTLFLMKKVDTRDVEIQTDPEEEDASESEISMFGIYPIHHYDTILVTAKVSSSSVSSAFITAPTFQGNFQ